MATGLGKNKAFFTLLFLSLGFLFRIENLYSQKKLYDYQSFASWLEVTASQKLAKNWSVQLDFQYRRRSRWSGETKDISNPLALPVQMVFRPWIHSHHVDKFRFSVSPLGYWRNSNVGSDGSIRISQELRTSFQGVYVLGMRAKFSQRLRYEFRFRSGDVVSESASFNLAGADFPISPQVSRVRYQIKWQRNLYRNGVKLPWYFAAGSEIFFSLGRKIKDGDRIDQNRLSLSLGREIKKGLRLEIGYLNHWVTRQSDPQKNHCLTLNLVLENSGELFHGDSGGGD